MRSRIKKYIKSAVHNYKALLEDDILQEKIQEVATKSIAAFRDDKKMLLCGNGGSASIASHFSADLSKNAKVRCINFNEANLLTCFSNDYGYEKWVEKSLNIYGDKGDCVILISSSGKSKNMINAAKYAKRNKFSPVVTLTGFNGKNPLSKLGNVNLVVNSKSYNFIENIHQIWLLSIVDLIIGKSQYPVNKI